MENINIRIARELNCIAKSLIAGDDIADHPGSYTRFTGIIDFKNNYATVKNATFKLDNYGIDWQDGIWLDGTWQNGYWQDGIWKKGDWKSGTWQNGKGRMSKQEINAFFKEIEKKYVALYERIPGVAKAQVDEYTDNSYSQVGRKYWFIVTFQTNKDQNKHRMFIKRLDFLENAISRATMKPDHIENVYMPSRNKARDINGEWYYYYDQDYATIEIFIYNPNER